MTRLVAAMVAAAAMLIIAAPAAPDARGETRADAATRRPPRTAAATAGAMPGGAIGRVVQARSAADASVLASNMLVTWYGNPRSKGMGILGERDAAGRARGLTDQLNAYAAFCGTPVIGAYELVAVVGLDRPGAGNKWRRRETPDIIQGLLAEARANNFKLILDVQPGRASIVDEVAALEPYLIEPDVYLALDPEFTMAAEEVPGREIGQLSAADVNAVIDILETVITEHHLPPKVLIVHQFRLDMLPDKKKIRSSPSLDIVLNMDGFGSQSLKLSSYKTVMRQGPLEFPGIKLFYKQDTNLFTPAQVMALVPRPSVVVYQ